MGGVEASLAIDSNRHPPSPRDVSATSSSAPWEGGKPPPRSPRDSPLLGKDSQFVHKVDPKTRNSSLLSDRQESNSKSPSLAPISESRITGKDDDSKNLGLLQDIQDSLRFVFIQTKLSINGYCPIIFTLFNDIKSKCVKRVSYFF